MHKNPEHLNSTTQVQDIPSSAPKFNPELAQKLRDAESDQSPENPETRFHVDPADYPIFSRQAGKRLNKISDKYETRTLSIDETLGKMVGHTAETIATLIGEKAGVPAADHVIYLDKSARPVSWLVDEFWGDFTSAPQPDSTFLAIDRRTWLADYCGVQLLPNEYVEAPDGTTHPASAADFDRNFHKIPKEVLAKIRALYIKDGIEDEDVDKIFATPTILDGKNLTIIDEVSRSGATLHIAQRLLKAAIPELKSVNGHVFWHDTAQVTQSGEMQMGSAPVWYPADHSDWRGRGVKDVHPDYFAALYESNPTNINRARRFGAIVLGEPLDINDPNEEYGQPSLHLKEEIGRMHRDYQKGHILPDFPSSKSGAREVFSNMIKALNDWGVEIAPPDKAVNKSRTYINLKDKRNQQP